MKNSTLVQTSEPMGRTYLLPTTVILLVAASGIALSQETDKCVGADKYPEPEPVSLLERGPLVLQHVSGIAVIRVGEGTIPPSHLYGACLSLFTADSHKFVASVPVDRRGTFAFGKIATGDYRLVERAPGLCTGNDAVRVEARKTSGKRRAIIVYFRPHEVDTCTTADYAK